MSGFEYFLLKRDDEIILSRWYYDGFNTGPGYYRICDICHVYKGPEDKCNGDWVIIKIFNQEESSKIIAMQELVGEEFFLSLFRLEAVSKLLAYTGTKLSRSEHMLRARERSKV